MNGQQQKKDLAKRWISSFSSVFLLIADWSTVKTLLHGAAQQTGLAASHRRASARAVDFLRFSLVHFGRSLALTVPGRFHEYTIPFCTRHLRCNQQTILRFVHHWCCCYFLLLFGIYHCCAATVVYSLRYTYRVIRMLSENRIRAYEKWWISWIVWRRWLEWQLEDKTIEQTNKQRIELKKI